MKELNAIAVTANTSIRDTLKKIDANQLQVAFVIDDQRKLLGVVTDGDVRRGILANIPLDRVVSLIMNAYPLTASVNESRATIQNRMLANGIRHMPVLNEQGVFIHLELLDRFPLIASKDNLVILMAGGLGSRLGDLTKECPKPLLKVAGKPIAELLLEECMLCGFRNFYFSVNYLAEMIQEHFQGGEQWGVNISYIKEEKRLGTVGALSLLNIKTTEPIVVANADIITRLNFSQALNFHLKSKADLTVCVRNYQHTVPYGVIKMEEDKFLKIIEKPVQEYFVSAGVYIINSDILDKIPKNEHCDMPDFMTKLSDEGYHIAVYPIFEYWLDVGRIEDLEAAHRDFKE